MTDQKTPARDPFKEILNTCAHLFTAPGGGARLIMPTGDGREEVILGEVLHSRADCGVYLFVDNHARKNGKIVDEDR